MSLAYNNHSPRAGQRAASAHHTEAGAKRETPYGIYYDTDRPRLFDKDDTVMVIDDDSIHVGAVGHVYELMPGNKYMVRFNWSQSAIAGFHERQLRKIDDRKKHRKKKSKKRKLYFDVGKVDAFSCQWGSCEIDKHPEIPERWAAQMIVRPVSDKVIQLPAPPVVALLPEYCATTIAHEKFMAFMESLDKPRYTLPELYAHIETYLAHKRLERLRNARYLPTDWAA